MASIVNRPRTDPKEVRRVIGPGGMGILPMIQSGMGNLPMIQSGMGNLPMICLHGLEARATHPPAARRA
jgi:hypothetical protein